MLETEIKQSIDRYHFLVEMLFTINEKVYAAFKEDERWFSFAPRIVIKFLNQAFTLKMLFNEKRLELPDQTIKSFEDLSAIYAILRMQFETHALFFHLFVPSYGIEENILRFRLWELDGIRGRIKTNAIPNSKLVADQNYQTVIEKAIKDLHYYQKLEPKAQKFLINNACWRFSTESLKAQNYRPISYDQLIKQTGIKQSIFADLYAHLCTHTHPGYVGVVQSCSLTDDETNIARYVAIMNACFVTSFIIEDLSKRFKQGREHMDKLTDFDKNVYESIRGGARE